MPSHSSRRRRSPVTTPVLEGSSAPEVSIRCARTSDAASIAPLFDAYRQFYGAESDVSAARHFLLERLARNESVVFMASVPADSSAAARELVGAELVGFAQLYPSFSSVAMRPVIVLNDLFVAPGWRRAHVARRLLREVMGYATRVQAVRVELSTQHTNTAARELYASLGFTADAEFGHLSLALPVR
jgi:ribosomal protein S18 acetylase RimI-like enzyme